MSQAFRHRLRVRYAECDAQGVVFNAHYVSYFDHTLTEWWRDVFGSYNAVLERGVDVVVAEVNVRYLAAVVFDDEIDITADILRLGTTSMTSRFVVTRAGEADVLTLGEVRHVFVDLETKAKRAIPDDVRLGLEPYLAGGEREARG